MTGKLWNKLFRQAIPFFVMALFALTVVVAVWALILCTIRPESGTAGYAIDLSKELVIGIAVAVVAFALGKAVDHWLQDHYQVDKDGNPRNSDCAGETREKTT